mmetsp:Transcript_40770/g.122821  ORF Transcript_40770/g.122821 Transcript_40770/m.122821 type:complete len:238 (+) Transcript_40770:427-1140(+)
MCVIEPAAARERFRVPSLFRCILCIHRLRFHVRPSVPPSAPLKASLATIGRREHERRQARPGISRPAVHNAGTRLQDRPRDSFTAPRVVPRRARRQRQVQRKSAPSVGNAGEVGAVGQEGRQERRGACEGLRKPPRLAGGRIHLPASACVIAAGDRTRRRGAGLGEAAPGPAPGGDVKGEVAPLVRLGNLTGVQPEGQGSDFGWAARLRQGVKDAPPAGTATSPSPIRWYTGSRDVG